MIASLYFKSWLLCLELHWWVYIYIYISDLVKPRNNTREDDHIGPKNWSDRFIHAGCLLKFIVLQGISIKFYCAKYLLSLSIRNAISRKAFLSYPEKPPNRLWKPFFEVCCFNPSRPKKGEKRGSSTNSHPRVLHWLAPIFQRLFNQ